SPTRGVYSAFMDGGLRATGWQKLSSRRTRAGALGQQPQPGGFDQSHAAPLQDNQLFLFELMQQPADGFERDAEVTASASRDMLKVRSRICVRVVRSMRKLAKRSAAVFWPSMSMCSCSTAMRRLMSCKRRCDRPGERWYKAWSAGKDSARTCVGSSATAELLCDAWPSASRPRSSPGRPKHTICSSPLGDKVETFTDPFSIK